MAAVTGTAAAINSAVTRAIRAGDLALPLPQELLLCDGTSLRCDTLLRLLPGKRGVFRAQWAGRDVLAKIFLADAKRQADRERAGYARLSSAAQPTPELLADRDYAGGAILLYEFLDGATALFREDETPSTAMLALLLDRLQAMYSAGIYQQDLHWGNFLLDAGTAVVIDNGAVAGTPGEALAPAAVIDNLGLLVAQFRRCDQQPVLEAVLAHPLAVQFGIEPAALAQAARQCWQLRKHILLQKIFRNTTATAWHRSLDRVHACRRALQGPELDAFLRDPDATMARGESLKRGNSATVVKLQLDGRWVVIKRYNMKSVWHWLRRCLRPSRAWTSWRNAHWLQLLGLRTPAPVAFLEMRCGPLRRRAYYIAEFVAGTELAAALAARAPSGEELRQLEQYFTVAASDHLVHGDMKATNLFFAGEQLFVLDLDAMREVAGDTRWRQLFLRDFQRFERNWDERELPWLRRLSERVHTLVGARG